MLLKSHKKYENCFITSPATYDKHSKLSYNAGSLPEKNYQKQEIPATFYIHSWELTPEYMPKIQLSVKENFVTYHNIGKAYTRMSELLQQFQFTSFSNFISEG